jgi:hypothetical protein
MQRLRALALLLVSLLFLAPAADAATVTIGNRVAVPNTGLPNAATPRTTVDLVHPATHTGTVDTARLEWVATCTNAVKIKFFRRTGDALTMTAERGPFNTVPTAFQIALSPPVPVQQGDLIAVTSLNDCGNPVGEMGLQSEGYLQYAGDVTGTVAVSGIVTSNPDTLALSASGPATERTERVIPVVGSVQGNQGSNFKTSLQIFNPSDETVPYKLVFRRAGVAGSSADTVKTVPVGPKNTEQFADIVAAMGQTGLGSLDVIVPDGKAIPVINTRVFNDAGAAGASGLSEEGIEVPLPDDRPLGSSVLWRGVTGYLIMPLNQGSTRYNVGIRTLGAGATVIIRTRNKAAAVLATASRTYPPHYFIQTDVATFTGTTSFSGSDSIEITVVYGSAIVYGASTDNTTNDPAVQFARGVFAVF